MSSESIQSAIVGQRLALVLTWEDSQGERECAVFFGEVSRVEAGLGFGQPGVVLDLPNEWQNRIRKAPPDLADLVEGAPYVLELRLDEVPTQFSPQGLVSRGF